MDIFNNDNENVNKVIVWIPHRMNKSHICHKVMLKMEKLALFKIF